jgi:hypothetical protein
MDDSQQTCPERTCNTRPPKDGAGVAGAAAEAWGAAAGLTMIAQNIALRERLRAGDDVITKKEVDSILLLDALDSTGRGPSGKRQVRQNLSEEERAAMLKVVEFWDKTGGTGIAQENLGKFTSAALAGAGAGALGKLIIENSKAGPAQAVGEAIGEAAGEPAPQGKVRDKDVPTLDASEFRERADALFFDLDKDHNGHLSTDELASAVQDSKYKDQDAQVVAALYRGKSDLEELSNDEWFDENDGITRADLAEFDKMESVHTQNTSSVRAAKSWVEEGDNFKNADSDNNGFLSADELDRALEAKDLSEQDRKGLRYMRENIGSIEEESNDEWFDENDGITRKDFDEHAKEVNEESDEAEVVGRVWGTMYRTSESQRKGINSDLFANQDDPLKSITPDAVKQGTIGNCYFLASLSALAATNPQQIKDMIRENGDGTYTVTFPGDADNPVTVKAPTDAEMGLYNGCSEHGLWAAVMEKAYGQYRDENRGFLDFGSADVPQEGGDGGGRPHKALELLTGKEYDDDSVNSYSDAELAAALDKALNGSPACPVGASVRKGFWSTIFGGEEKSEDGFPTRHAYSIVGFEPDGNGGGHVIVRNPWGGANDSPEGTKRISLDEFRENFTDIQFQK